MKNTSVDMRYTLCFLTRGDAVLMLHRRYPPNQGLWNGVGGHLEPGETPLACVLREVREETGFHLANAAFRGLLTWEGFETPPGGLYLFTAEAPAASSGVHRPACGAAASSGVDAALAPPSGELGECSEGLLAWKPREWVFSSPEVVSNIAVFGPLVLNGAPPQEYFFSYRDGRIASYEIRPLDTADFSLYQTG